MKKTSIISLPSIAQNVHKGVEHSHDAQRQIRRIERGEINTSVNNIFVIAKILDVPLQTIFNW